MRNVVLVVEYDGTAYHGYQIQPGESTVQGALEAALLGVTGTASRMNAAGRTDAGVHASGQVVSFRTESTLPVAELARALNAGLPNDIVVKEARETELGFHARYSARGRAYRYSIWNAPVPSALRRLYTYHWRGPLDVDSMQAACRMLLGTHDYASFAGAGVDPSAEGQRDGSAAEPNTIRTVLQAECRRVDPSAEGQRYRELGSRWDCELVAIDIAANGFLPHMVRNVVGTLLRVGSGKMDLAGFAEVLAARDRTLAGPTAPARGLCLVRVWYD